MKQLIEDFVVAEGPIGRVRLGRDRRAGFVRAYSGMPKRALDIVFCILVLPLLLPVLVVLYVLVRMDGGPAFYGHTRIGRNGKPFKCWKMRTMVVDADKRLKQYLSDHPAAAAEWRDSFKLNNDPRITRLGAFLRASSLDEIPQFFNVLRGEMSVVGPRPVTRSELSRYGDSKWAYLGVKPGITGLWQVSGRNNVSYAERVEMDVDYCRDMGPLLDTLTILRTFGAVMGRTGR